MLIALIPSLMLTAVEDLNELISALHFKLCSTYRTYLKIILCLFVLHSYTTNNEIRAFIRFLISGTVHILPLDASGFAPNIKK